MEHLRFKITSDLKKGLIGPRQLLSRCRVIQENSRKSIAYQDPIYLPFYYYLGKNLEIQSLMVIGFRLGLSTTCFVQGCRSLNKILAFQPEIDEFYSSKLGVDNVKDFFKGDIKTYYGRIDDVDFGREKWDMALVDEVQKYEEHLKYLEFCWSNVKDDGIISVDYIGINPEVARSFEDFCKIKNRKPIFFEKTRYTIGMLKR